MTRFVKFSYGQIQDLQRHPRNREVNNVKGVMDGMLKNLDVFPPLVVNTVTNRLLDGQRRRKAYLKLIQDGKMSKDTELYAQLVEIYDMDEEYRVILECNRNSKGWTAEDYAISYSKISEDYRKLIKFCEDNELCHVSNNNGTKSNRYRYAGAIIKGKGCEAMIKDGKFTATEEEIRNGEAIHVELCKIADILNIPKSGNYIEPYAIQWGKFRNKFTFDKWLMGFKHKMTTKSFRERLKSVSTKQSDWQDLFGDVKMYLEERQ